MEGSQKRKLVLRTWLETKEWWRALDAMEYAATYHTGRRKGGDPEFDHQISIAHYIRTLPGLLYPEDTIIVALLHDTSEDYHVSPQEIKARYGDRVADAVWRLTKEYRGQRRDENEVFQGISECPIASIVKPADRIHNQNSMVNVFKLSKMQEYIDETEEHFFHTIKSAKRRFPQQSMAYENEKLMLQSQVNFVKAILAANPPQE